MDRQNIQRMILNSRNASGIAQNSGVVQSEPPYQMIDPNGDIDAQQLTRQRIMWENQYGPGSFPEQAYLDAKRNEAISQMPDMNNGPRFSGYDPATGTQMDFNDPRIAGTRITPGGPANSYDINTTSPEQERAMQEQIGGPGFNSPPQFASVNNATARGMNQDPNFNAPMGFSGGQPPGLLDEQSASPNSGLNASAGESGWMKDKQMRDSYRNMKLASLLFDSGRKTSQEDSWD